MALVLALANRKSATAQTTLQAAQAEVIERALRPGLQDLDMLLQEEEICCNAQTYSNHAKARYGLRLPLFSEDNGMAGGKGEA